MKNLCIFMIVSRRILLRMTNVSDRSCRENQNTNFIIIIIIIIMFVKV